MSVTTAENFNQAIQRAAACLEIAPNVDSKLLAGRFVQELKIHRDAVWDITKNPRATEAQKALGLSLEENAKKADQLVNGLNKKFELGYNYKKIALTVGLGATGVATAFLVSQYDFSKISTHLPDLNVSDFGILDKISNLFVYLVLGSVCWTLGAK